MDEGLKSMYRITIIIMIMKTLGPLLSWTKNCAEPVYHWIQFLIDCAEPVYHWIQFLIEVVDLEFT